MERACEDLQPFDCAAELVAILPWLLAKAVSLTRLRCDAEDLVQATALRVLSHGEQFAVGTNFRGWAGRIMLNLSIEQQRRRATERRLAHADLEAVPAPPAEPAEAWRAFELDDMRAALPRVATPFRDVLTAQLHGPMSHDKLAVQLGIPRATVATRLHRGRQLLRAALLSPVDVQRSARVQGLDVQPSPQRWR
jgi:RNA polymerase sigma-70 factor, ECF subfamily